MRDRRVLAAWFTVVGTLAGAGWLLTYRVPGTIEYIEYIGGRRHRFHPTEEVMQQPWWSVYATVALVAVAAVVMAWLLPQWRSALGRVARPFGDPHGPRPGSR